MKNPNRPAKLKKASEDIKAAERKYRSLVDLALVGVFQTNLAGDILYANKALYRMYGYRSLKSFKRQGIKVRYRKISRRRQLLKELKEKGKVDNFEFEFVKKNGQVGVGLISAVLDGTLIFGMLSDVTKVCGLDGRIKQAAKEWRRSFDSIQDLVSIQDAECRLVKVNKAYAKAVGSTPQKLIGKKCFKVVHGTKHPIEKCPHIHTVRTKKTKTIEHYEPSLKKYLETSTSPIFSEAGKFIGTVHVSKDISERVRATEQLNRQKKFLETVIESLKHPFYVIDANDYSIKMSNAAAGFGNDQLSKKCYELSHRLSKPCGTKNHPCTMQMVKKSKQPQVVEHVHYDRLGNRQYVEVHAHPIFDAQGAVHQVIEYALDVTARKNAELQLKQAHDHLEQKVRERTKELHKANIQLRNRVRAHRIAEKKLFELYRHLGITNRRISILLELNNHGGNVYRSASVVIEGIVDSATNISGARSCILFHFDSKIESFYLLSANGIKQKNSVKRSFRAANNDLLKKLARTKKRIQGSRREYDLKKLCLGSQIEQVLILPIFISGKMRGALLLGFDGKGNITTQDLDLYEAFAIQASMALSEVDIIAGARY